MEEKNQGKILLFDVDGTLTAPRLVCELRNRFTDGIVQTVEAEMLEFLEEIKDLITIGFVGGSDLGKIKEQLGDDCVTRFHYSFSQNGLLAMKGEELLGQTVRLS